jgi:hypothetical protein
VLGEARILAAKQERAGRRTGQDHGKTKRNKHGVIDSSFFFGTKKASALNQTKALFDRNLAGGGRSGDHVEEVEKYDGEGVEVAEVEADLRERHGTEIGG